MSNQEENALKCPQCQQVISDQDINQNNDIAYCRNCNLVYSLANISEGSTEIEVKREPINFDHADLTYPPTAIWYSATDSKMVVGVSYRSFFNAIIWLVLILVYGGAFSLLVLRPIATQVINLLYHGDIPVWFPVQTVTLPLQWNGEFWMLSIVLIFLFFIGDRFLNGFFMAIAGKQEIRINADMGSIFTGFGFIGRTRQFDPENIQNVQVEQKGEEAGYADIKALVVLETKAGKTLRFGEKFNVEQCVFVAAAIKRALDLKTLKEKDVT